MRPTFVPDQSAFIFKLTMMLSSTGDGCKLWPSRWTGSCGVPSLLIVHVHEPTNMLGQAPACLGS